MAGNVHLYLVLQGGYDDPTLQEETWQIGVRCRMSDAPADPVGTLPTDWQPATVTINRNETDWTIQGNWRLDGPALGHFEVGDWLNDQVGPAAAALIATGFFAGAVRLDRLKVYPIGNDGKAVPAPPYAAGSPITLEWKAASTPNGTATGGVLPLQCSAVISLRTSQVGRKGRGRFYLPGIPRTQVGDNGMLGSGYTGSGFDNVQTFLDAIAFATTSPTPRYVDAIVTGGTYTDYGLVSEIRLGNVVDTQRRRRRSLTETYSILPIPAP